jgi:hypothetical protein
MAATGAGHGALFSVSIPPTRCICLQWTIYSTARAEWSDHPGRMVPLCAAGPINQRKRGDETGVNREESGISMDKR